jgi:hypothetical protein
MRLLPGMLALLTVFCCSPFVRAEAPGFKSFLFDGASFKEAHGAGAILVRDGMLPALDEEGAVHEDPLPTGSGAVAVLCYRQSSGGKLKNHAAVQPMTGVAVSVRGTAFTLAARTGASGYLILALPAGSYRIQLMGFTKQIVIEAGKTALVPIRGGKRMVD